MKKILTLSTIAIILLLACNSENKEPGTEAKSTVVFDLQQAKTFIDSINRKFSEAIKNGDSTWAASQYSPDGEILLAGSSPIKGKDISSMWGSVSRSDNKYWKFTTTDLQGDENFLVETGDYEIKDGSQKLVDKGYYVVTWKKQSDGSWKLYRDIGVSNPMASK